MTRHKSTTSPPSQLSSSAITTEILGEIAPRPKPEPTAIVIFGITGDLAGRKLAPALFHQMLDGNLPEPTMIIGVARNQMTSAQLVEHLYPRVVEHSRRKVEPEAWAR